MPALEKIEALKLFVLNLGHTFLTDRWLKSQGGDDVLVRNLMDDAAELASLKAVLTTEVRPAFVSADLADEFDAYIEATIERFANPYLDHRIADIAQNHSQKVERRIAAALEWAREVGDLTEKPILSEIVASNVKAAI